MARSRAEMYVSVGRQKRDWAIGTRLWDEKLLCQVYCLKWPALIMKDLEGKIFLYKRQWLESLQVPKCVVIT